MIPSINKFFDNHDPDIIKMEMKSFDDNMKHMQRIGEVIRLVDTTSFNEDLGMYVRTLVNNWKEEDENDWN